MDPESVKRAEELFLKVRGLTASKREKILANVTGDQLEIKSYVERRLARDQPGCETTELGRARLVEPTRVDFAHTHTREHVGGYDIQAEVARGGMGIVYKVRDEHLKRSLALKAMRRPDGSANQQVRELERARFLEEARLTAQLDHPGIVPVHELGDEAEREAYFTMSLVKGKHLGDIFQMAREEKDGWNLARAIGVLVKACDAIAYAHSRQVIHRDLKPPNIMVGRFGAVYVMDWGLAKVIGQEDLHDLRLKVDAEMMLSHTKITSDRTPTADSTADSPLITMDGSVVGTPAYMPPEQAKGLIEQVDTASDVYSLGAILYSLLTGQPPYVEPGSRISPHTVLGMVIGGPPQLVQTLNPDAPPELVAICSRAMARDKETRYASSVELAEDLQAYLDGRVVNAYRTGAIAELTSWVSRNRAAAAAACLLAVGVLLSTALLVQANNNQRVLKKNERISDLLAAEELALLRSLQAERQLQYDLGMGLAVKAWESGIVDSAREQLNKQLPEPGQVDLRGFEWFYLDRLFENCESAIRAKLAHSDVVTAVAFASNGRGLASGCDDGDIRIWDPEKKKLLRKLTGGHQHPVRTLRFGKNGSTLVSVDDAGNLCLWDPNAEDGNLRKLEGATRNPYGVITSPDGRYLAAAGPWSSTLGWVWDLEGPGMKHQTLEVQGGGPTASAFSPDGNMLVMGTEDGSVVVYKRQSGEFTQTHQLRAQGKTSASISGVAVSVDGKAAIVSGTKLEIFDLPSGRQIGSANGDFNKIGCQLCFSSSGNQIAATSVDGGLLIYRVLEEEAVALSLSENRPDSVVKLLSLPGEEDIIVSVGGANNELRLWEAPTGRVGAALRGHANEIYCLAVSRQGEQIATAGRDYNVSIWDARSTLKKQVTSVLEDRSDQADKWSQNIWSVGFSSDGQTSLSSDARGYIRMWDVPTGSFVGFLHDDPSGVGERNAHSSRTMFDVFHSANGDVLASVSNDGSLKVWDLSTRSCIRQRLDAHIGASCITFSPDGSHIVTGGNEGTVRVWRRHDLTKVESQLDPLGGFQVYSVACSPQKNYVAVGATDNRVYVWDWQANEIVHVLEGHTGRVATVDFSADGRLIASGSHDGTIRLWRVETGEQLPPPLSPLRGHFSDVIQLKFAPDGRSLFSAGFDKTIRIWNFDEGRLKCVLNGHTDWVFCLDWSADGSTMATGSLDGTTRLWRTSPRQQALPDNSEVKRISSG